MSRTACVWIPQFELRTRLVADPSLQGQPVLIADAAALRALVLGASEPARAKGIQLGMPISTARALCPEAVIIPPDPEFVRRKSKDILAELYRISPVVGQDDHEAFFLSLQGLAQLYPDEQALAQKLHQCMQDRRLSVAVAIADSPISAWVVARATYARGATTAVQIVPQGQDAAFLARLPLESIPMPEQLTRMCRVLGLRSVAELQNLPPGALLRRFGRSGLQVEQRARACSPDLFRVEIPETIEQSEIEIDQPTADLEPLLFLHKSVLDRLLKQVATTRRALAALQLELTLADSDRTTLTHTFRPARPTLDGRSLLELITLWLNSAPAPDMIGTIVMRATEVAVATPRQLRLFERDEDLADDALQQTLSRLVAAFGHQAVVHPMLCDRYLPEARLQWQPMCLGTRQPLPQPSAHRKRKRRKHHPWKHEENTAAISNGPTSLRLLPVLRLVIPPLAIEVRSDQLRPPGTTRWTRIVHRQGPNMIEGEWWEQGFRRAYYLLTTAENESLWIYRDEEGYHLQAYLD